MLIDAVIEREDKTIYLVEVNARPIIKTDTYQHGRKL